MSSDGILIAFEGIDGAGKTTQAALLSDALTAAGETVILSKEPTDGPWGRKIRESAQTGRLPLDEELNAFIEDRKEHVANLIQPSLDEGKIVILDRYFYSTIAYQGARGKDIPELVTAMNKIAPQPDIVLLLDVEPGGGLTRISDSRNETPNAFERADSLAKARSIFNDLANESTIIRVIDGSRPIETVHTTILRLLVDGVLKKKRAAKSYDADALYRGPRIAGECE